MEPARSSTRPGLAEHIVDLFVYTVVLNLAMQFFPTVISETFTLSLLTAVLLKGVLELTVAAKTRLKRHFADATTRTAKTAVAVSLWLVLVSSKFLVIELTQLIFGDRVQLGGFWTVTGLIMALMIARGGVRRLIDVPADTP